MIQIINSPNKSPSGNTFQSRFIFHCCALCKHKLCVNIHTYFNKAHILCCSYTHFMYSENTCANIIDKWGLTAQGKKNIFKKRADLCDLENKHISPGVNVYLSELVRMQINTHGWKNDCRLWIKVGLKINIV